MSDPNAPPLNLERIVETLDRHGVDYVLVGGVGVQHPGHYAVALTVLGGHGFSNHPYCPLSQLGWVPPLRCTPVR